jgi:hypothetical protein
MEILAKYVTSEALIRIAEEFERTLSGTPQQTHSLEVKSIEEFMNSPEPLISAGPVDRLETLPAKTGAVKSKPAELKFDFGV